MAMAVKIQKLTSPTGSLYGDLIFYMEKRIRLTAPTYPDKMGMSAAVYFLRKQSGFTQQQLGSRVNMSATLINHIEARSSVRAHKPEHCYALYKLCLSLGLDELAEFFSAEEGRVAKRQPSTTRERREQQKRDAWE